MKETNGILKSKALTAVVVVIITLAALAVTMPLLGCDGVGYCEGCAQQVETADEHAAPCKQKGHFDCNGFVHEMGECGEHLVCIDAVAEYNKIDKTTQTKSLKSIRTELKDQSLADHQAAICGKEGHFVCDGIKHGIDQCEHDHVFSEATCIAAAECSVKDCNESIGEKDPENHVGDIELRNARNATCAREGYSGDTHCTACDQLLGEGHVTAKLSAHRGSTETRNARAATCAQEGYSGDVYCLVCGTKVQSGGPRPKSTTHSGGTETRNAKAATCAQEGYSGDVYCLGCGDKVQSGKQIQKSTTHSGGTKVEGKLAATCCKAGYSGDTYCKGCGDKIKSGSTIAATGKHPAAPCHTKDHHTHDKKDHSGAGCRILGHYVCDGKEHRDWACVTNDEVAKMISVQVTIADPGATWSYTIGGITVNQDNLKDFDKDVLLGGYSIKVYFSTMEGETFTINASGGKKVYIEDPDPASGYNTMIVDGENPATITVSQKMLKVEANGNRILFITIK